MTAIVLPVASWFEMRSDAALLTTRNYRAPHPEEAQSAVSKDEVTPFRAL